jgi:hypothetical protein
LRLTFPINSLSVHRRNRADTSLIVFFAFCLMRSLDCIGIFFLGRAILMLGWLDSSDIYIFISLRKARKGIVINNRQSRRREPSAPLNTAAPWFDLHAEFGGLSHIETKIEILNTAFLPDPGTNAHRRTRTLISRNPMISCPHDFCTRMTKTQTRVVQTPNPSITSTLTSSWVWCSADSWMV